MAFEFQFCYILGQQIETTVPKCHRSQIQRNQGYYTWYNSALNCLHRFSLENIISNFRNAKTLIPACSKCEIRPANVFCKSTAARKFGDKIPSLNFSANESKKILLCYVAQMSL